MSHVQEFFTMFELHREIIVEIIYKKIPVLRINV